MTHTKIVKVKVLGVFYNPMINHNFVIRPYALNTVSSLVSQYILSMTQHFFHSIPFCTLLIVFFSISHLILIVINLILDLTPIISSFDRMIHPSFEIFKKNLIIPLFLNTVFNYLFSTVFVPLIIKTLSLSLSDPFYI